ncbi:hypothetical protein H8K38_17945 [Undibacterium sp. FT79W]|uniref:hypothetical protein n=1 Tax=Undibacterium sp. FT79W TaxID=2762296 RepID=UPI00164A4CDC|nr:hypothetical protein [Undibacterium sp. FT79W]MBC3879694.1 hypothetical protein [Undibacterium sp. FT79W]
MQNIPVGPQKISPELTLCTADIVMFDQTFALVAVDVLALTNQSFQILERLPGAYRQALGKFIRIHYLSRDEVNVP